MINYEWRVYAMTVDTDFDDPANALYDPVRYIVWAKGGTDDVDGCFGMFQGRTELDMNTLDSNNFTNFEDLTEEQILDWVRASFKPSRTLINPDGSERTLPSEEEHMNARIEQRIEKARKSKALKETKHMPWEPEVIIEEEPEPEPEE